MKFGKKYHQPFIESKYNNLISSISILEREFDFKNKNYFSRIASKVKSILFYEIPIKIEIVKNDKSNRISNKNNLKSKQDIKKLKVG